MKIRRKIVLITLVPLLILWTGGYFVIATMISNNLEDDLTKELDATAIDKAITVETYLQAENEKLSLVTSRTKLRDSLVSYLEASSRETADTIKAILIDAQNSIEEIKGFDLYSPDGEFILSSSDEKISNEIIRTLYDQAKKGNTVHLAKGPDNEPAMILAGPLEKDGILIGVIFSQASTNQLYEILSLNSVLGETGESYIVRDDGMLLSPRLHQLDEKVLNLEIKNKNFQHCLGDKDLINELSKNYTISQHKGGKASIYQDEAGIDVVGSHVYLPQYDWCIITEVHQNVAESVRVQILTISGLIFLGLTMVSILIIYLIGRQLSKPIEKMRDEVEAIDLNNPTYNNGIKTKDEIGELSRSFHKLTTEVKKSRQEVENKVEVQTSKLKTNQQELEEQQEAMLSVLEDVEEEKKKTGLLAKDLEKYKLAVDNASDHIIITDPEGIVIYMNDAAERITGFDREEIIGHKAGTKENWGGLMGRDFYKELWKVVKKSKKPFIGGLINQRKSGDQYDAAVSIVPIIGDRKEVLFFVGIERDITREKEVDRAKTEFVSLASHQLQTPLTSINWFTEMLMEEDSGKLNAQQFDFVKSVHESNQRMIDLVNGLLNVSRLEHGTFTIEPQLDDITKIANSVLQELEARSRKGKVKVSKKYAKIPKIKVDPKLLRIILQNLLSNAIKYTPEKGQVNLEMKVKRPNVLITVKDTGYGIPTHQQDKMFSKLFRADNVREKDTEGTGLGLYIVKQILDNSGGRIWFKSKQNKGTTFYVTIPLKGMKEKKGKKKLI